eukprot:358410_1
MPVGDAVVGVITSPATLKNIWFIIPTVAVVLGLLTALFLAFVRVLRQSPGEGKQLKIALDIETGAKAFLTREYMFLAVFVVVMAVVVGVVTGLTSTEDGLWWKTVVAFITGAVFSGACGWNGMIMAVKANVRTTEAAKTGLNAALKLAFASGAVMGLTVVSVGLLGILVFYSAIQGYLSSETQYLAGFAFGASSIALFARVAGGIYTKAADVGADLVGKVEAGIPEDDPRNPATIADNVGDNVGDVAGMGADLFESFVGSIVAGIQLAPLYVSTHNFTTTANGAEANFSHADFMTLKLIVLPIWIASGGIIASILGIMMVRTEEGASNESDNVQEKLLGAIRRGIFFAAFVSAVFTYILTALLFGWATALTGQVMGTVLIGLAAGLAIGVTTEYCTSFAYKPTISIAKKSRLGPSGVVIQGLSIGMLSTVFPVVIIFIAILGATALLEVYGIAIAAVGMLATLGVTLATDAFGPVADNAGGIAEMAELPAEVRERTDALDALGNTTAATGKGFAIGSAVLTALALLTSFTEATGLDGKTIATTVNLIDQYVISGAIFGACLPFVFAALTMLAVGRSAGVIIQEVRRQFREIPGLLQGEGKADYTKCVSISTHSALIEMVIPGLLAIVAPLFIGFLLGPKALAGMLAGGILTGFLLGASMANSGGAWDNAKKFVEAEGLGKKSDNKAKGSDLHMAVVVGDTIGDPFKDTSGPALNILIKLMSIISLVFAPAFAVTTNGVTTPNAPYATPTLWAAIAIGVATMGFIVAFTMYLRHIGFGKIDYSANAKKPEEVQLAEVEIDVEVGLATQDISSTPGESQKVEV